VLAVWWSFLVLVSSVKLFALGSHPLQAADILCLRTGESFWIEAILFVLQIEALAI
jgi:hypothetical protein